MLTTLPVLSSPHCQMPDGEMAEMTPSTAENGDQRPRCAFVTLGCKINQFETEAVRQEILDLGYREVSPRQAAEVYVVNTCSVTRRSGVKSRRAIQRVARRNPNSKVLVMGCSTPSEKESFRSIPQVAVLAGNEEKGMIASFLQAGVRPGELVPAGPIPALTVPKKNAPLPPGITRDMMELSVSRMAARTRAYIKIQDGCNSFCSFCVIPYLRGLSRSRPAAAILAEARRLGEAGFREVVLAGIHLQDYGEDLGGGWNLSRLLVELRGVAQDAGIWRIRLSSIGVQSFTEEMVEILKDPLFCPHWHIPVQSGDDGVLKKMRRDYTRQEYLDTVQLLKETFEPASITTDVIVGHPGEDDDAFTNTVDLCVDVGFSKIHLFPFSPREGTRAQSMGGQVPAPVIHERMKELGALEKELSLRYKRRFVGESVEVLAEDAVYGSESGSVKMVEGFTERYVKVCFRVPADEVDSVRNTLQPVRVVEVMPEYAVGRLRRDS